MQARGAALVVGGLGLFTIVMLATPDTVGWVFVAWILVVVAMAAVGTGLVLVARRHAATIGSLTTNEERPPPWPVPDPVYLWPGPRLISDDIFEVGGAEPVLGTETRPAAVFRCQEPPEPEVARPVPWWRRSARTAVAAGVVGAVLARLGDGKVSSGRADL